MSTAPAPHYIEGLVLEYLERHAVGAERAIPGQVIAKELGLSLRAVQSAVDVLIKELGEPIVSSTHRPMGYAVASSRAEIQRYQQQLRSRIHELTLRIEALDRCRLTEPDGPQLVLL